MQYSGESLPIDLIARAGRALETPDPDIRSIVNQELRLANAGYPNHYYVYPVSGSETILRAYPKRTIREVALGRASLLVSKELRLPSINVDYEGLDRVHMTPLRPSSRGGALQQLGSHRVKVGILPSGLFDVLIVDYPELKKMTLDGHVINPHDLESP